MSKLKRWKLKGCFILQIFIMLVYAYSLEAVPLTDPSDGYSEPFTLLLLGLGITTSLVLYKRRKVS